LLRRFPPICRAFRAETRPGAATNVLKRKARLIASLVGVTADFYVCRPIFTIARTGVNILHGFDFCRIRIKQSSFMLCV
jgi:hypothetical protein